MIQDYFIPGLIRGFGGLASYFMSAAAVNRQNRYNSPKNQIRRLRDAGIPLVAAKYFQNTQTDLPDTSGISNAAQGLASYYETDRTKQEVRKLKADADISEERRNYELQREIDSSTGKPSETFEYEPQLGDSNLVRGIKRERAIQQINLETGGIIRDLKQIDLNNAPEKIRAEINNVLENTKRVSQEIKNTQLWLDFKEQIQNDFMKGGTGWDGIERLIKAFFYKMVIGQ